MIDARTENSNDNFETPRKLILKVVEFYGGKIDLDAFCTRANSVGVDGLYFDEGKNAFGNRWYGNVWVNSPYGRMLPKVVAEIKAQRANFDQCIQIAPARMGSVWFETAAAYANAMCVLNKRPVFTLNGEPCRDKKGKPTTAQFDCALFYYGNEAARFRHEFANWGTFWRIES